MKIEIKGVQFVNKGAELMLVAVVSRIREYWPDADIVLKGSPLSPYKNRAVLGAYQKLSLRKNRLDLNALVFHLPKFIRRYLETWGVITEADIDIVLDASGFAYGDQWGALQIRHLGAELSRCKKNGIKYIFLPQAFGPFSREQDKRILGKDLKYAALICARDDDSFAHIKNTTGNLTVLRQYPDFTNAVNGVVPEYWRDGRSKVCFVPNSNMLSEKNLNGVWGQNYMRIMMLLINQTIKLGYQPILLNHEGQNDRNICNELNSYFNNELVMIEETDSLKVKGILGASKAVVCSRFHGCVSALSQGVPCLGTSWSHKYEHLYNDYDVPDLLINPVVSDEALLDLLESVLLDKKQYSVKLCQKAESYKQLTEQMWALVRDSANN